MSEFSLTDATIVVGGYDFSGDSNQVTLAAEAEALESTNFRSRGWRSRVAGLKTVNLDVSGFWDSEPDEAAFSRLGTNFRQPCYISPTDDGGAPAFLFRGSSFTYSSFGEVGALTPFSLGMMNTNREGLARGAVTKARGTVNATGATGTVVELATVPSGKFLYATLNVFSAGTTITAVLESDDNANFTSATTRITFGPVTTTGGVWGTRVAGSITDTFYRLRVSAITGTFDIACAVGIG